MSTPEKCGADTDRDDVPREAPCVLEADHDGTHDDGDGGIW